MKRKLVALLLPMFHLFVLAQTSSVYPYLYRIGDIIDRNGFGNFDIGEGGDSCVWDFRSIKIYDRFLVTEFTSDCERKNVVAEIYGNTRHYCSLDSVSINDIGFENNNMSVEYDRPKPVLLLPLDYGKMKNGVFHGNQMYCEKLFGRQFGTYSIEIDGKGKLLLPDGKVLDKAYRVHCTTETGSILYDEIHTKAELVDYVNTIHPFTADSIKSFVSNNDNEIRHDEVYKWYADGYRYPIVEVKSYGYGDTPCKIFMAYYCSPDEQSRLYDIENENIRKAEEKAHCPDNTEDFASDNLSESSSPYTVERNGDTFIIRVGNPVRNENVDAVLSDVSGIVLRRASGDSVSPITLNCSGLRNGEYAIKIIIGEAVYDCKVHYEGKQ